MASGAERVVRSFARWLAGLDPKYGSTHTWLRSRARRCLAQLDRAPPNTCPLCGARFRRPNTLVHHIIKVHGAELRELVTRCRAVPA